MKPDRPTLLAGIVVLALVGASVAGGWMLGGENLDRVIELVDRLEARSLDYPFSTAVAFAGLFALTTALTLPTATLMCLFAGFVFGTAIGTLVSLVGALGGAAATFVTVRFLGGERVREFLLRGRTSGLVRWLEADAFFYLVAFRIVPVAPFFAVNAAGALIRISAARYLTATALGLLPITLLYASLGAGLESLVENEQLEPGAALEDPRISLPLAGFAVMLAATLAARRVVRRRRNGVRKPMP